MLFLFSLTVLFGCSVKVHTGSDAKHDFSKYKTFCWLEGCEFTYSGPAYLDDSLLREHIKDAITLELERKGLSKNEDSPDLLVDFHISVKDESSIIYHHQEDDIHYYKPFPQEEVINYLKGTLVIDMVDKSEGHMVWRSEAIGYMDVHPDLSKKNIQKGIRLALKKFPPKEGKK